MTWDKSRVQSYLNSSFNIFLVNGNIVNLIPEGVDFDISDEEADYLCGLGEESCIEINPNGRIVCGFGIKKDNTLYITDKCNSNCIMCPMAEVIRRNGHTIPTQVLMDLVRYMPSQMEHITITGGEPFYIKEDLFKILDALKNRNKAQNYLLLSNGRVFSNHDYCDRFAESVPENFLVGIPLHGPDSDIHDLISQSPGSFSQTTKGISNLLATKSMSIEIRIVVNKINAPYLIDLADFIIKKYKGINSVKFMGMEMLGNAILNSDKVWIPYEDAFSYIKPAIDLLVKNGIDVAIYNFPLCFVAPQYWNIARNSITAYKIKYSELCNDCKEKSACGGMFAGTDKYLKDLVKPIV